MGNAIQQRIVFDARFRTIPKPKGGRRHAGATMADQQGYIIEFHRIGNAVKVSAIDPATLTEVSIIGAATAGDADLTRLVVRKLEYVIAKHAAQGEPGGGTSGGNR